jgi:hypothetical protein
MGNILLVGEKHSIKEKDLLELYFLQKKRELLPLSALSVELESGGNGPRPLKKSKDSSYPAVIQFVLDEKIPVYATDHRNFPAFHQEKELANTLENSLDHLDKYRTLAHNNMVRRNQYMINCIEELIDTGFLMHIGGLNHVHGIYTGLKQNGHDVEVVTIGDKKSVEVYNHPLSASISDVITNVMTEDECNLKPGSVHLNKSTIPYTATVVVSNDRSTDSLQQGFSSLNQTLKKDYFASCSLPRLGQKQGFDDGKVISLYHKLFDDSIIDYDVLTI